MPHTNVSSADFKQEVIDYQGKVLVDFWALWCGPCQMLGPIIEQISEDLEDLKDSIKVVKVNVDDNQDLAQKYGIQSIPTVLIFQDGQVKQTLTGLRTKQDYINALEE